MKILLTTDWYSPAVNGVVTSVLNLKKGLEGRGHEVRILTLSQDRRSYTSGPVTYIGSVSAGRIYPGARLRFPSHSRELQRLTDWGPEIIHSNCEFSTFLLARRLADKLDVPLIHTYHTVYENYTHYFSPNQVWGKRAVRAFSRWMAARTDAIITPTRKVASLLREYGISVPLHVIPSGLDQHLFAADGGTVSTECRLPLPKLPRDGLTLVYVGRLAKEKNCEELLQGMAQLREKPVRLLIVGDGPHRAALEQLTAELHLDRQVFFTGMVPPAEVGAYYRLGDVFVCASTSETQGLTYAEALLSGLPLLCRRDPCLDGVLLDGENGWQYGTVEEFSEDVLTLLRRPEQRAAFARRAREAGRAFTLEAFAASVESVYEAQADRRRLRRRIGA